MRTLTLCLMFLLALTGRAEDPAELQTTLDNEPVTVNFAFNLGTAGQKADFGEGTAGGRETMHISQWCYQSLGALSTSQAAWGTAR